MASQKNREDARPAQARRFKTGVKEFNEIVPGLPMPAAVLVEGRPGAGKAMFSLSLMDTGGEGKKVVFLTNNTPEEIGEEMKSFKMSMEPVFVDCYSWLSGDKADVDSLSNLSRITFLIEDSISPGACLLFDSLTPLVLYNDEEEIERFMQQAIAIAKSKDALIFFTVDLGTYHSDAENTFRSLCDCVVHLDPEKGMRLMKMRDTPVPAKHFFYEFGDKGLKLRSK